MLASFSVVPMGAGESVKEIVAEALAIVDGSGLSYQLGPMHTVIEGDSEQVEAACADAVGSISNQNSRGDSKMSFARDLHAFDTAALFHFGPFSGLGDASGRLSRCRRELYKQSNA